MLRRLGRRQRTGFIGLAFRWIRRIRRIAMVFSIAAGVYRWWQSGPRGLGGGGGAGRRTPIGGPKSPSPLQTTGAPERQPEMVNAVAGQSAGVTPTADAATPSSGLDDRSWVEPLESGSCPASHPVKANDSSGIYHVPGGRFYDRTVAVRCYLSPAAATDDGYRPAKA